MRSGAIGTGKTVLESCRVYLNSRDPEKTQDEIQKTLRLFEEQEQIHGVEEGSMLDWDTEALNQLVFVLESTIKFSQKARVFIQLAILVKESSPRE